MDIWGSQIPSAFPSVCDSDAKSCALYLLVPCCCHYCCSCGKCCLHHFLLAAAHLFLVLSFGFWFLCVPIFCLSSFLSATLSLQKGGSRSHYPPEKLHPWLHDHRITPFLQTLLSGLSDGPGSHAALPRCHWLSSIASCPVLLSHRTPQLCRLSTSMKLCFPPQFGSVCWTPLFIFSVALARKE